MNPVALTTLTAIGCGSIIAALIAASISRAVAIANLRQAWINALRDDIAEFVSLEDTIARLDVDVRHLVTKGHVRYRRKLLSDEKIKQVEQTLERTELLIARIDLRLNPNEADHNALIRELRNFHSNATVTAIPAIIDRSKKILKKEWQVTKWGGLEPAVAFFRKDLGGGIENYESTDSSGKDLDR